MTTTQTGSPKQIDPSITLANPWTGRLVEYSPAQFAGELNAYPWPEDLRARLHGLYDRDEDWLVAAVADLGPEAAGRILLGS